MKHTQEGVHRTGVPQTLIQQEFHRQLLSISIDRHPITTNR